MNCYFCNKQLDKRIKTKEHIPAKALFKGFKEKLTHNIITVHACRKCNDLFYLVDQAKIEITEEQSDFMQILMKYQLEGRYPEYYPKVPLAEKINDYLCQTKALLQCYSKML